MDSIYLSYSGRNCEAVLQVMEGIIARGYALACDCLLPAHESFAERVARAMAQAKAVVAVMTEDAKDCPYMARELELAQSLGAAVLPVCVGRAEIPPQYATVLAQRTAYRISEVPTAEELDAVFRAIA